MRSRGAPVSYSTESPTSELLSYEFVSQGSIPPPLCIFIGRILGVHGWPHWGVRRGKRREAGQKGYGQDQQCAPRRTSIVSSSKRHRSRTAMNTGTESSGPIWLKPPVM